MGAKKEKTGTSRGSGFRKKGSSEHVAAEKKTLESGRGSGSFAGRVQALQSQQMAGLQPQSQSQQRSGLQQQAPQGLQKGAQQGSMHSRQPMHGQQAQRMHEQQAQPMHERQPQQSQQKAGPQPQALLGQQRPGLQPQLMQGQMQRPMQGAMRGTEAQPRSSTVVQPRPGAGAQQQREDLPEIGETVICKITKILDYGVFVELLEYESLQGFVHISQVASSWIKNIRNFVKENQIRAGRVVHIDRAKGQIDVSFAKVSDGEQKARLEAWKQLKKPQKLLEMLAQQHSQNPDTLWEEIAEPLLRNYDSLYNAFTAIVINGASAAKGVPDKWVKPLQEIISKNMEMPVKTVRGTLNLKTTLPNGVDVLKSILLDAKKAAKGGNVELFYEGSGRYVVKASSNDFKSAERIMREVADAAVLAMQKAGGKASFEKEEPE